MGVYEEINKYKDYIDKNILVYYTKTNLKRMKIDLINRDNFDKKYSRGGLCMIRGYYNPSLIEEIVTTNISRGNLLKKVTKRSRPDYCYYFHQGEIKLVQKHCCDEVEFQRFEWIDREGDVEYSILTDPDEFSGMVVSKYKEGKVIRNSFLNSYFSADSFDLILEFYEYDQIGKLVCAEMNDISVFNNKLFETKYSLKFNYDERNMLNDCMLSIDGKDAYPCRIPPIVKSLITGEEIPELPSKSPLSRGELLKELRKIISSWKGENIYAISLFINHDDSTITDFEISFNHEEGQIGEERWNYAFWEQDGITLDYLLEHRNVKWKKLLDLCAVSIKQLQKENFLKETFGKDIAVIIHGYEYEDIELEATRNANPNGQAEEFFDALKNYR